MTGTRVIGRLLPLALMATVFCHLATAAAHESATTTFTAITVERTMVRVRLTLSQLPPGPLADRIKPAPDAQPDYAMLTTAIADHVLITGNARPCTPARKQVEPPTPISASLTATVDFVCPDPIRELTLRNNLFDVLGQDLHMIARIDWAGESHEFTFGPDQRSVSRALPGPLPGATDDDDGISLILIALLAAAGLALAGVALVRSLSRSSD